MAAWRFTLSIPRHGLTDQALGHTHKGGCCWHKRHHQQVEDVWVVREQGAPGAPSQQQGSGGAGHPEQAHTTGHLRRNQVLNDGVMARP